MKTRSVIVNCRVSKAMRNRWKAVARRNGRTLSSWIRWRLELAAREKGPPDTTNGKG